MIVLCQTWYKDETMSTRVKDETGASAFSLINKGTGQALRHAPEDLKQVSLNLPVAVRSESDTLKPAMAF